MKLLACQRCKDVVEVRVTSRRFCECGASWAECIDSLHVRYDGPATILGLFNPDLEEAMRDSAQFKTTWPLRVHAFPPRDGVLRPNEHRALPSRRKRHRGMARAHRAGEPCLGRCSDGRPGFANLAAPE